MYSTALLHNYWMLVLGQTGGSKHGLAVAAINGRRFFYGPFAEPVFPGPRYLHLTHLDSICTGMARPSATVTTCLGRYYMTALGRSRSKHRWLRPLPQDESLIQGYLPTPSILELWRKCSILVNYLVTWSVS